MNVQGFEARKETTPLSRRVRLAPTLVRYLLRGLLTNCLVSFLVLEAVQGIVFTVRATEGYSLDVLLIFPVLLRALGQALTYALPLSLLFGTGFLVGRLNADREVTALRGFGIPPLHAALPAMALGCGAAVVSVVVNHEAVPRLRFANRNVGILILEHLGYLGEGWNLGYRAGARSLWIRHYDGPLLEGVFFSLSDEGEGGPFSEETLKRVRGFGYPVYLYAERALVRRGTTGEKGAVVVDLRGANLFFDNDFLAPDKPSDFMNLARIDAYPLDLFFSAKEPSIKDMPFGELRREIRRRFAACLDASEETEARKRGLHRAYAQALTEFHRRFSQALTAFTFPVTAFFLGLSLRSRNRLLPFFLASALCPAVYFAPVEIGPELLLGSWEPASSARFAASLGPWCAVYAGNLILFGLCAFLWVRLRAKPR